MKRILLLIFVLLPFLGIGQTQMVRWNGSNGTNYSNDPIVLVSNVSANTASGTNTFTNVQNYFRGVNYTTATSFNSNQYMQFSINAINGSNINLNKFDFWHRRSNNGATKFIVRYSTNNSTWTQLGGVITVGTTDAKSSIDLSSLNVSQGTTFYIRIYPYDAAQASGNNDYFYIWHGAGSGTDDADPDGPQYFGTVNCSQGNPATYGVNSWIGYVYDWVEGPETIENPIPNNYLGFVTENLVFDRDITTGAVSGATTNICGTAPTGSFFVRYKANVNVVGKYAITVGGDDGYRFSIDGGVTWEIDDWGQHSYRTTTKNICLNGSTNLVLEYFEGPVDSQVSFDFVDITPTAPTSITGTNLICPGASTVLTANGTTADGVNTFYEWGTGTVGSNVIAGQTNSTITVTPASTTTYWVRVKSPATCEFNTAGVTRTVSITPPPANPNSLTAGTNPICSGGSTTLTAQSGLGTYEWGTGTIGSNIIAGQSNNSISVSPTVTTTYWVRVKAIAPCTIPSSGLTIVLNVAASATAPTSITGINTVCPGGSITMTATGGTGNTYQWGTGSTVGSNIIAGQTSSTLTRTNITSDTTYWVRRQNVSPCGTSFTSGVTKAITVGSPGDETTFGTNEWIGYVYTFTNPGSSGAGDPGPATPTSSDYIGRVEEPEQFDRDFGTGGVTGVNPQLCGVPPTNYYIRYKMRRNFTPGSYTFTINGDDGYRFKIDGGSLLLNEWILQSYGNEKSVTVCITGQTDLVLEYFNQPGQARLSFSYVFNAVANPSPPTSITGTNSICAGSSTTLTAAGTTVNGTTTFFEWGTGTAPNNIIAGATTATLNTGNLSTTTTYWVRVRKFDGCNTTYSSAVSRTVTVTASPVAPTSITGTNPICTGTSTTLTATAGLGTYEWGTGATVGSNIIGGATTNTINTGNLTSSRTYWVRVKGTGGCGDSAGITTTVTVIPASTRPTSITSTSTNICSGTQITLTANGTYTSGTYQWGTGTVGTNIIANETSNTLVVSPTAEISPSSTITYWVRLLAESPCTGVSGNRTINITVAPSATAPTLISGENSYCPGAAVLLTASGGSGATYQWGTGSTIGSNIINGQTASTITVNPNAATTYWVRRVNNLSPCTGFTGGVTKDVTVGVPGAPSGFGDNEWNVFGYTGGGNSAPTGYSGFYVQNLGTNVGVDTKLKWGMTTSPSNASDWNGCVISPNTSFTFIHKRKGFPCGNYLLTYTYYDDETTIIIKDANGVTSTINSNTPPYYNGGTGMTMPVNGTTTYALDSESTIEIRTTNSGVGESKLGIIFTPNAYTPPVAPTSITGINSICSGSSTTLTANGTSGTYEWGTGSVVGTNPIAGTTNTITVSPTTNTTYWVRVKGTFPCPASNGVTYAVTVTAPPVAPTSITGTTSICSGSSTTLTANGTSGTYQWGTGSTVGSNIISGQSASTLIVSPTSTTTYWVRVLATSPCTVNSAGRTATVTVTAAPVAPTAITGTTSICSGTSTTLTATAGLGTYEWGTGSTVGTNPIAGQTTNTLSTGILSSTTTYWVRVKATSPCITASSGITTTVTVTPGAVAPTSITGTNSICSGSSTTLTANGTSGTYEWGTGTTVGTNQIAGTTNSITVSPTSTTTYWVRVKGTSPCGDSAGVTYAVTVTAAPVAPTAITGTTSICSGTSTTLTATAGLGTYEWGTGSTVGTNPIAGQTTNTLATGNLSTTTTYWVRVKGTSPCGDSSGITTTVTVTPGAVAPTSITGTNSICSGSSTTLTATAGLGTYEWGTGTTVGTNAIAGTTNSIIVSPTSTTTYWVRVKGTSPCGDSAGVTYAVTVTAAPVAPTAITGTTSICSGTSTTLTATAGLGTYEWGTGSTVGTNPIAGQTTNTLSTGNLSSTTTYWVRVKATSPCTTDSSGITTTVTVTPGAVAPTAITGTTSICSGSSTTLTATAGLGTYEWGTGTAPNNIIAGATTNTLNTGNLTSSTTYWVRVKGNGGCSDSSAITQTVTISAQPVRPTSLTSTSNAICSGTQITLTANGSSGTFQWGTGTAPNNIIAGESSNTLVVSPTSSVTYWVRVLAQSPCTTASLTRTRAIAVTDVATAPTAIDGIETSYCPSGPVTLTATGGTGTTYQWGTGSIIGTSPIAGETSASIIVSPSATTTYWVRRVNASPCSGFTSGVTKTVTVLPTPGDTSEFGTNEWNVYGYNSGGNSSPTDYRGYYVQNLGSNVGIDTKVKWDASTSPSAASDWQGCAVNNDGFTMIHKRKGFPCGRYTIAFTYYDEDTEVIINDATGSTSTINFVGTYNGGPGLSQPINGSAMYALDANSTIEIRTTDITSSSEAKLGMTFTSAGPAVYSNGAWVEGADPSYVDITLNDNFLLPADLTVCTCTVNNGFTATVPENLTLTVIGNTTAVGTGKFIIEDTGAFVQVNESSTYTGIPASFTSKRKTQPIFRYDFTYWSSPVEDFILKNVSPITIYDKFFSWNSTAQVWLAHKTNLAPHTMIIGKGYSIRGPQNFAIEGAAGASAQIYEAKFIGKPNTSAKSIAISNGAPNRWNLIGNPYPSAINVIKFLELNKDVMDGTLYFWTHKSQVIQNSPNPDYAVYSSTDYVAVNLSGSVSNETLSGSVSSSPTDAPYGLGIGDSFNNIASAQSFFVKGKETGAIGNEVVFNNAMRVREGGNNNQFFKPGLTTPVKNWETTGKHRIWLNIKTPQNDFNQALVGYIQEATNGLDWGYDGEVFSGGNVSIYSLLGTKGLTIQARGLPFSAQEQIPLGYSTSQTGIMNISIERFDGLFSGQGIYLEDKVLNVVHNLKNSSYNFTTVPGTFDTRFVLRFLPEDNLGTDNPTLDANSIVIYNNNNQISVKAKDLIIDQVIIYDLAGRVLLTKNNVNATEFTTSSLAVDKQVVLVKVITDTKAELVKKVLMK